MKCRWCGRDVSEDAQFCDGCGATLGAVPGSPRIETGGGDVRAQDIYQSGGDICISLGPEDKADAVPAPNYDVKWSWKSPLTQARLAWISVILGALGLLAAYQGFTPLYDLFAGGSAAGGGLLGLSMPWLYAFTGLLILFARTIALRQVAANRSQHLGGNALLPALTGWGGQIGFARFTGRCACGGRLRFYSKPLEWVEDLKTGRRLRVTKREMVAECGRDRVHHVWRVSPVDSPEDES